MKEALTYKDAGVDIHEGEKAVTLMKQHVEKTFNKNRNKDWYLSRDELVKYKVVDKIVTSFDEIN